MSVENGGKEPKESHETVNETVNETVRAVEEVIVANPGVKIIAIVAKTGKAGQQSHGPWPPSRREGKLSIAAVTKRADIFRSLHVFVGRHLRSDMSKISIRFFNDREVRAVWDDVAWRSSGGSARWTWSGP